jgi:xanthine/uracil permease
MSIENTPQDALPPRADLYAALAWIVFGAAIAIGAWNMDRLEHRHINQFEVPGLVPGVLGAVIFLLGLVLAVRSIRRGALQPATAAQPHEGRRRMAAVFTLTLVYALVLVGHGLPFWLATFAFVTGFILVFDAERQAGLERGRAAQALRAVVYGACTSAIVTLVFEQVFLVRLP